MAIFQSNVEKMSNGRSWQKLSRLIQLIPLFRLLDGRVVKNLPANARDAKHAGSIPGPGRSPGGGTGNLLQYSCLGNPMDTGAWLAIIHGVAKSQTRLSD